MTIKSKNIIYIVLIFLIIIISSVCIRCEGMEPEKIETDKEVDIKSNENNEEIIAEEAEEKELILHLSDYERWVAECIVMGESGGESYEGQILVAQCLLNACLKDNLLPSEVQTKYKYSGWNDSPSKSVKKVVREVFDNSYKLTDEFILYFYAPKYCDGRWHETQCFVTEVGGHRFFTEWELEISE